MCHFIMGSLTTGNFLMRFFTFCHKYGYLVPVVSNQNIVGFDYGPLGTELRRNVFNEWWNSEVTFSEVPVFPVTVPSSSSSTTMALSFLINNMLHQHYGSVLHLTGSRLPFGIASSRVHFRGNNVKEVGQEESKTLTEKDLYENSAQLIINSWKPVEWTSLTLLNFCSPKRPFDLLYHWQKHRLAWWRKFAGVSSEFISTDILQDDDGSHKLEIQYKFPWGVETLETVINMGSSPLNALKEESGVDTIAKNGRKMVVPHIVVCSSSLDLAVVMYLSDGYQEAKCLDSAKEMMRLHYRLVPYKVTLAMSSSSGNTAKLREHCELIMKELKRAGITVYPNPDIHGQTSLDSQYARFDTMGIQFSITINDATLKTGTVGLRNRDTATKEQVHITELKKHLLRSLKAVSILSN